MKKAKKTTPPPHTRGFPVRKVGRVWQVYIFGKWHVA